MSCMPSAGSRAASAAFRRVGVAAALQGFVAAWDAAELLRVREAAGGVGRPVVTRRLAALPRRKLLILRTPRPSFRYDLSKGTPMP